MDLLQCHSMFRIHIALSDEGHGGQPAQVERGEAPSGVERERGMACCKWRASDCASGKATESDGPST